MSHHPRKRFGQNFLRDERVIHAIVAAISPRPDEHLVEIGPGQGALTRLLLPECRRLDTVELDRDLVDYLHKKFAGEEKLRIHSGDALKFDFASLSAGERLRIIGNLPYNISTPLLFHLFEQGDCIRDMHFMLQKEVVDRMVADPGTADFGRLSVMLQYRFHMERLFVVPPGAFNPAPKVDSAIVRLIPKPASELTVRDEALMAKLVLAAFGQRRKMLRNNLREFVDEAGLERVGIKPTARAEELGVADYVSLTNALAK